MLTKRELFQCGLPAVPGTPAPDPEFDGKTGNGFWADTLAQIDSYTRELLDTVDNLGIRDNTIFIFISDNGPDTTEPWTGWAGPWRGSYFTGLEGSLRVPFIVRCPGKIAAGRVSNEIVHEMDIFTTLAALVGGKVPTDRTIDGVDKVNSFSASRKRPTERALSSMLTPTFLA